MISYATKSQLRGFADQILTEERATLRKRASERTSLNAAFLSHSSKDDEFVVGAIRVLEGHGAAVYIDEIDPTLPPYTNKDTASKLKQRISQAKKFVMLASDNSKESKWVPWELGIADGAKGLSNIALFPAVDGQTDTAWTSWEYLGLYRRIVWGDLQGYKDKVWMVLDETANTATELSQWLTY